MKLRTLRRNALTIVITGTDTGVGKTVLTALLAGYARSLGLNVRALKPICSGGRADAHTLRSALGGTIPLREINPWHFRAPLAPLLVARAEGRRVRLAEVLAHVHRQRKQCELLVVEAAGGLLSPLGEGFSARELVVHLRARPVIVCANRLGAVNQTLLALAALPPRVAAKAQVVLTPIGKRDPAAAKNLPLLAELVGADRVHLLPRIASLNQLAAALKQPTTRKVLRRLLESVGQRIQQTAPAPAEAPLRRFHVVGSGKVSFPLPLAL